MVRTRSAASLRRRNKCSPGYRQELGSRVRGRVDESAGRGYSRARRARRRWSGTAGGVMGMLGSGAVHMGRARTKYRRLGALTRIATLNLFYSGPLLLKWSRKFYIELIIHRKLNRILPQFQHPELSNVRHKIQSPRRLRGVLPVLDIATGARVGRSFGAERVEGEMDQGFWPG